CVPYTAMADFVGFRVIGGSFDYEVEGTIRDGGGGSLGDEINLKNDLALQDKAESFFYAYIEHPIPVIPNIRVGSTSMTLAGSANKNTTLNFNGVDFNFNTTVTSSIGLDHSEIALYYEIIDTVVDFDLGLNFKIFDGEATLTESAGANTTSEKLDFTIPMLYASLNIPLPLTGLSIGIEGSTVSYDGNTLTDYLARIRYTSDFNLGIEAGVRNFNLKIEDTTDQTYGDIKVSGPYVSLFLYF
ncbi:MAG: TIGR04219 family outer membrane beta-barrel protein, partial [Gammaproteobacteria bacterium]